jgi:CubicO group peptidase (beta-lactamase class C family)
MKQKRTPLSAAGVAGWLTTMTLLSVLMLAAVYLAHPRAMAASGSHAAPDFAAIDKFVETEMQAQRIPGLALGIVQGDQ